jgi:type IV pilus assembly protein PilY1
VIIGGGYDNVHDTLPHPSAPDTQGAGVYFLDLESGEVLWRAGADVNANLELSDLTRSIPSQIRVIDITGDGFADRMYAADMGGQILRFDITNGNTPDSLVTGGAIAQLGAEGNAPAAFEDTRRFYNTPDVSIFNDNIQDRRFIAISIGSGYRAHPLDNTNSDRFYSIRDKAVFNSLTQFDPGPVRQPDTDHRRRPCRGQRPGWCGYWPGSGRLETDVACRSESLVDLRHIQ